MPIIRTVCGDIAPSVLGVTYMHEHVLTSPPESVADPDFRMDNSAAAERELGSFHAAGGRALVEMTTRDYGRNPTGLQQLSAATGVHVVCVTGWQKHIHCYTWVAERSVSELANQMIHEITVGIDGLPIRAGVIKASSSLNTITDVEHKVFQAAALAQRATGALITTHTEAGTHALQQVDLLGTLGCDPTRLLIGHLDRCMEYEYHLALVRQGVTIGYDQIGKEKYAPDTQRADYIARLCEAGFAHQIALSCDMARRSSWPSYGGWGGPGLTTIVWRFAGLLRERGVPSATIAAMLVQTPARLLAMPGCDRLD